MVVINQLRSLRADARGATAVEFALVVPLIVLLFVGMAFFALVLSMYSALQQISAEAARAALPGLTPAQQSQLATQYVNNTISSYGFLNPNDLTVTTTSGSTTFQVTLAYTPTGSYFPSFGKYLPAAPALITRSATIQLSGY